jgi:hypothetical protein
VLPGGQNFSLNGLNGLTKKSFRTEFKAEFYQKWKKRGEGLILKRSSLFKSCVLVGKQFQELATLQH